VTEPYSTDVDDFLAHYGILGMHWGKRKQLSPRQKQLQPARQAGAVAGAVGGLVVADALTRQGPKLLRSKAFNKYLVDNRVDRGMARMGLKANNGARALLEDIASHSILKENFAFAKHLSKPSTKASIALGSVFVASVLGSAIATGVKDRQLYKARQLQRAQAKAKAAANG